MRVYRVLCVILFLVLLVPPVASSQQPPPMEPEYASIAIDPSYQEAAPGAQLAFNVSALSTLGGTVSITVPSGINLIGEPICSGPCRGPFVTVRPDATIIEVTLDGETAVVGFQTAVSPSARIGETLNINVIMVGGPQAIEMAAATIYLTEPLPTQPPSFPTQAPSSIVDNRMLYLEVSPSLLRLAPGGNFLYHVQPVRWGMWSAPGPHIDLEITVPTGFTASSGPFCGRGDAVPTQEVCDATTSQNEDGSTTYSITPGYTALDGSANGVYLVLRANSDIEVGASSQVSVTATVDDDTLAEQPLPVTSTIQVVSSESLLTPQDEPGTVGAILEVQQGFTTSGSSCSTMPSDSQLGLYEFGLETRFATATLGTGRLSVAMDGSGTEVCLIPITFIDVPLRDIYIMATSLDNDIPCRACVYGSITITENAEAVFLSRE